MCEIRKSEWKSNFFYINIYLEDCLDIELSACQGELMPEEALTY